MYEDQPHPQQKSLKLKIYQHIIDMRRDIYD